MARSKNNPILKGLSGRIGNTVVIKNLADGSQVVSNMPLKRKHHSVLQEQHLDRFQGAKSYAKRIGKKPELKELYERRALGTTRNWHNLAVGDCMNAPEIKEIHVENYMGEPGEIIRVRVTDDFKVASVEVTITDGQNQEIEKGLAQPRGKRGLWRFFTTIRNLQPKGTVIRVVAMDLAKNKATATLACSDIVGEQRWSLK